MKIEELPLLFPRADIDDLVASIPKGLFIGGKWIETARTIRITDPATEEVFAEAADAGAEQVSLALDAAVAAASDWAARPPRQRGEILRRAFEGILARKQDLAILITLEMGKPYAESLAEVTYAAEFFRWFSEEAVRIPGTVRDAPEGNSRLLVVREPVGPCYLILPWNVPLGMATRKIGPALAAGCTAVVKPARETVLSTNLLMSILQEAGLPDGVVNTVQTSDPGSASNQLLKDPRLRKVSFTGSTNVGRALVRQSADNLLRVSMELGGNAPFIVFEDADVDLAVSEAMRAKLRNNGEACTAANRFFVDERRMDEFAGKLRVAFEAQVVGPGLSRGVTIGPLISRAAATKVEALVDQAVQEGAERFVSVQAPANRGYFVSPTILTGLRPDASILAQEIFGPVAPLVSFRDEDEALALANSTEYGLASYFFTESAARVRRVSGRLEAGMVGVNKGVISNPAAPFGGVKSSGFGREGGTEGIHEYLQVKYVAA